MKYLSWLDDQYLIDAIQNLLRVAKEAQNQSEKNFNKNVIDPFSAVFQMAGFELSHGEWLKNEQTRQAQKTLQNHIGDFHQIILGGVKGWENLRTGNVMDLVSSKNKMLAEIKNKHNTVKGSDLSGLYKSMVDEVMPKSSKYHGYTSYYVTVIPKKAERFDKLFVPSDKQTGMRLPENEKIRMIDGASFYDLVTKKENALKELFDIVPKVLTQEFGIEVSAADAKSLIAYFSRAFG